MPKSHSTNGRLIPAVAYYRKSNEDEGESVAQQKAWAEAKCPSENIQIVRDFTDQAVAGHDTGRRADFHAMLAFCEEQCRLGTPIECIVIWSPNRLSRSESFETGHYLHLFMQAGTHLLFTASHGWKDLDRMEDRILFNIEQDATHNRYVKDMSQAVLRGMLTKARRGEWLGGRVPYAYRLQDKRLVLGPEEEIRVVRWLFTEYAFHGATLGDLMDKLNADGVTGPGGKLWGKTSVYKILLRPVYTGVMAWNRRHEGKFHEVRGGEIATASRMKTSVRANGPEDWVVCEAPHLAIVDRDVFDRVQKKLAENQHQRTPNRGKRVFALTGLLFCGHCGWPMHGAYQHPHKDWQRGGYIRYICGNYNIYRTRGGCLCNTFTESFMLDVLSEKIAEHFRKPEIREALRVEIRRQEQAEREGKESPVVSVNARITELDRKIDDGTEKWLTAPPGLTDIIGRKLEQWRQERDRLHAERRELAKPAPSLDDLDAAVERILEGMDKLRENIAADPKGAKAILREIVEKVECRFTHVPYGATRRKSVLTGGTIHIREDVLLCRPVPLAKPLITVTPARTSPAASRAAVRRPYSVQPRAPTSATALASAWVSVPRR
jgi:site-specific DNA recombinase